MSPRVSVILPVWNGERFLAEAIESVTCQTIESFELLVVDDGSTDGTLAIACDAARRDSRVFVHRQAHLGIAHALNTGIRAARGCYIARMDADDWSMPSRLQTQIAFLDAHPACVAVGSAVEVIDAEGEPIGSLQFPERHDEIAEKLMRGAGAVGLAHPTVVMRRDAVLAAGGYRAEAYPSEDLDLWIRLSDVGELANIPDRLLRYRRHLDTVRVREHVRQRTAGAEVVRAARARRGLDPVKPPPALGATQTAAAVYHFECAGIALKAGRRKATIRHARATIASAPLWPAAYAALAASALPMRALVVLAKMYTRLRR